MDNPEYRMLLKYISDKISIDGSLYKDKPFKRRLAVRMRFVNIQSYGEYLSYLKENKGEMEKLKETLTINVTRFFRNMETFDYLENLLSKGYIKGRKNVKILSAGSSTGEEAYSLAIICDRISRVYSFEYRITGIDIDEIAVLKAQKGIYTEFSLNEVSQEEKDKCFSRVGASYSILDKYRKNVNFVNIDIKDMDGMLSLGVFDIIVCRNILIYFSKDFQEVLLNMFAKMLKENGILVLGKVEIIMGSAKKYYEPINIKERIYKKIANNS